jgi:hypothetical protein
MSPNLLFAALTQIRESGLPNDGVWSHHVDLGNLQIQATRTSALLSRAGELTRISI